MPEDAGLRFVVVPKSTEGRRPNEFTHTMPTHPLVYQELPFDPEYAVYAGRLSSMAMSNATDDELYWLVRRKVVMRHTGELPLEIRGPDAARLADLVFPRPASRMKVGRCSYQFPCYDDGGMITDGVLLRLAEDLFWYVQADGDLYSWLRAHAAGMDVAVTDPDVWVSQVQGPDALSVLEAAVDPGGYPERLRYFDIATVPIAGQRVIVSRTGFTNELGWEFYLEPDADTRAVGDRILAAGEPFGMKPGSAAAFRARRIEAGILNAGSDFDETVTPFAAGLGQLVDLDGGFIGGDALRGADRRRRTWGLRTPGGVARLGRVPGGVVCSSAWSPYQQCGVAIVRLDDPDAGPGATLEVACIDGDTRHGEVCDTPMYDRERAIPRGKLVDIPPIP